MYGGVEQLVACWAHNPKVGGSSPSPATKIMVFTTQRMSTIQSGIWKHNPLPKLQKTQEAVKNGTKRVFHHYLTGSLNSVGQSSWFVISLSAVRIRQGAQNIGLISLCMDGSKHPIDYGVMAHGDRNWSSGLRFKSFLISNKWRLWCNPTVYEIWNGPVEAGIVIQVRRELL